MAHVAGLLASAVVTAVGNKLGSAIGDEVTMLWSFKDDLKDMKDTLQYMEAALKDAERRSATEELVRLWLNQLKHAAYDISYMLDEFQANSEPASRKIRELLPQNCLRVAGRDDAIDWPLPQDLLRRSNWTDHHLDHRQTRSNDLHNLCVHGIHLRHRDYELQDHLFQHQQTRAPDQQAP
ncbi:hypothetical protein ZWY2020_023684 [Hordeum vulgare]|nr:hypothetical protein ZWY2020_023684 [Hordeum vulgare]